MGTTSGRITILRWGRLIPHFRQATVIAFSAMTLLILAFPAQANLLITNGSFQDTGGKTSSFGLPNTTASGGSPYLPGWDLSPNVGVDIACVVFPSGDPGNPCGAINLNAGLAFWASPGLSPDGGNFIAIDGDPTYAGILSQTISGLQKNQFYTLSFYQAAVQFVVGNSNS